MHKPHCYLDWDYSNYVEMNGEWNGLWDVAAAINRHLASVDPTVIELRRG